MAPKYINIETVLKAQGDLEENQAYLGFVEDCKEYVEEGKMELRWGGRIVTLAEVCSSLKDAVYLEEKAKGLVALLLRYDPNNLLHKATKNLKERVMKESEIEKRISVLEEREELRKATDRMLRLGRLRSKERLAGVDPAQGKDHTTIVSVGVKWIPVAERLPTEGREYLVVIEGQVTTAVWDSIGMPGCFRPNRKSYSSYPCVTYWAEMPALPSEVAEEADEREPLRDVVDALIGRQVFDAEQIQFVKEVLAGCSISEAAEKAGYKIYRP